MTEAWRDIYFTSRDGLRLYGRHYPAATPSPTRRPVLCLTSLTGNSRDFHLIASHLARASEQSRDVYTLDYRGRGRSAYDPDWRNYAMQVELGDVLDFMTVTGLRDAAVIGTSRGGLLAMVLGLTRPGSIGLAVLNDIGPVIERDGLVRMIAYVGRVPLPASWAEAIALVRGINERHFPAVPEGLWETIARQTYNDDNGRPAPGYDKHLARAVSLLDGPAPALWAEFQSLARVPLLVVRGERSDMLAERTVDDMRARHPSLETVLVPGQGHAPLLMDVPTVGAIERFLATHDRSGQSTERTRRRSVFA